MIKKDSVLTRDSAYAYIENEVFRWQPKEYCTKFPGWPGLVGLELESHVFLNDKKNFLSEKPELARALGSREETVQFLLHEIHKSETLKTSFNYFEEESSKVSDEKLFKSLSYESGDQISFEPGGQIEFSGSPKACLNDALQRLKDLQALVDHSLEKSGKKRLQIGINPFQSCDEIGLVLKKSRYKAMDEYFSRIGPWGRRMMRQTATVQVNLDFGKSETELAKRYLLANLLAPFVTAMFAYSPASEGRVRDFASIRSMCWRHIDTKRTGIPPNLSAVAKYLNKKSCVDIYHDFAMKAPLVFFKNAGYRVNTDRLAFKDWLDLEVAENSKLQAPKQSDWEEHLSLLFPEVRARGFMELRSVDVQSKVWQGVPAFFYSAMLYDSRCLEQALDYLLPFVNDLDEWLLLSAYGLRQEKIRPIAKHLFELALDGFSRLDPCFQGAEALKIMKSYYERFVRVGRTPADDLVDEIFRKNCLNMDTISRLENQWVAWIEKAA